MSLFGKITSIFLISLTLGSLVISDANAELTSSDYVSGSGDNWLTIDSQTGLQWLDVNLTINQSFDQVRLGEWYANGFRYATKSELQTLFKNAGTPDDNFNLSNTYYFQTKALIDLLGAIIISLEGYSSTYGFIGTDLSGNDISINTHPIGLSFSAQLGKLDFFPYYGEAHFTGGHPFSHEPSSMWGSFLVRVSPVPEPNIFYMYFAGLIIMILLRRKFLIT